MRTRIVCQQLGRGPAPHEVLSGTSGRDGAFLLESALRPGRWARWSYLGLDPFAVLSAKNGMTFESRGGRTLARRGNAFAALRRWLREFRAEEASGKLSPDRPEFRCGAAGYLSYELGRLIERLPGRVPDPLGLPDLHLGFYDRVLAYDHVADEWFGVAVDVAGRDMARGIGELERLLADTSSPAAEAYCGPVPGGIGGPLRGEFTAAEYEQAVGRAIDYVRAGDVFQVNFTQRLSAPWRRGGRELYRRLRRVNPAPFAAYYDLGGAEIVSASPELYLRVAGARVETRPIKGTRRRGRNAAEDRLLGLELLGSPKDRAELTMIVDLERNDLGRVCSYGSVMVGGHLAMESYPTVHHLVSTVSGRLHAGKDIVDLLKASFPGGSITGAPKVRAMQIIDELERSARGVYTGAVGYMGFDGTAGLNLAIRTFTLKGDVAHFGVGGGVVADSTPAGEYQESMDKARGLIAALESVAAEEPVS